MAPPPAMYAKRNLKNRGFTALITALIISVLLIAVIVTTSGAAFLTRFSILGPEFKAESQSLAEACVEYALLNIFQDPTYVTTNETVTIATGSACRLVNVSLNTPQTGQTRIDAQGTSNDTYTNLRVTVNSATQSIVSWVEVPNFP